MSRAASGRPYVVAWLSLLLLTAASAGGVQLPLGAWSTVLALSIAAVKVTIVGIVFMHLGREPFSTRLLAGLNVAWVLLICLGLAADVAVR